MSTSPSSMRRPRHPISPSTPPPVERPRSRAGSGESATGGPLFQWSTWNRSAASRSRSEAKIHVSALVRLGELTADDIQVQLVTGRVSGDDRLYEPRVNPFPAGVDVDGGLRRYEGWVEAKRAGAIGYTVRVVPYHPLLASQAEMGLAALPASIPTPPSAGYVP